MEKIDKKDKKILFQLCENAKQPLSEIAKKTGLSKNSVSYRIERLKKIRLLGGFTPQINLLKLDYNTYDILIKLKTNKEEQKIVTDFLSNYNLTYWLVELFGEWDILLEIAAKNIEHFAQMEEDILKNIGKYIEQYEVHTVLEIQKIVPIAEDFFDGKKFSLPNKKGFSYKLDEKDKQILHILAKEGLPTNLEISKKVKLTPEAVAYRIKKLLSSNTIMNFFPIIEPKVLGYSEYLVILNLRNPSEEIKNLKEHILNQKNIQYAFQGATKYEIVMLTIFKDIKDLDNMIADIKSKFFNIVHSYNFMLIKDHLKFTHLPIGILER